MKVIWGNGWDKLLAKDTTGKLLQLMNETIDGDYQTFKAKDALTFVSTSSVSTQRLQHWLLT